MNVLSPEDRELLKKCLAWAQEHEHELDDNQAKWREVFTEWLDRYRPLSARQHAWVHGVSEHLGLADPEYRNDYSAGRVPRGEALATPVPDVLRAPLPKRPPGGRA